MNWHGAQPEVLATALCNLLGKHLHTCQSYAFGSSSFVETADVHPSSC